MKYRTKDFFISACILATGIQITDVIRQPDKACFFVFNTTPEAAHDIIQKHWSNELMLPTRTFVEAIHELKSRIYQT